MGKSPFVDYNGNNFGMEVLYAFGSDMPWNTLDRSE